MQRMTREANRSNIAIFKNKAYWLKDNVLFVSELSSDGRINPNTTRELDVFSLPDEEMDSLIKIIDTLNG